MFLRNTDISDCMQHFFNVAWSNFSSSKSNKTEILQSGYLQSEDFNSRQIKFMTARYQQNCPGVLKRWIGFAFFSQCYLYVRLRDYPWRYLCIVDGFILLTGFNASFIRSPNEGIVVGRLL